MQLFESENMTMSFKQAIEPSHYKYVIGSLAGRSESMIRDGVRKLPSPITVNVAQYLVDESANDKRPLFLQFYLNCGSEVFCLLKHKQTKVKSGEYSYRIEEQLGKIERNEKKPTKPSFKLGVLISRKFLVLDTLNFTRKFNKYRNREQPKEDPSILCWVESNSFQSATRDEICKPKGGTKHNLDCSSTDDLFEQIKEIKLDFEQTVEKQVRLKRELEEKLTLLVDLLSRDSTSSSQQSPVSSQTGNPVNRTISCSSVSDDQQSFTFDNFEFEFDSTTFQSSRLANKQTQIEQIPTILPDTPFVFSNQIRI